MTPNRAVEVYLAPGATDLRKSINGLSILVESHLQQAVFSGSLFVFCNRRRDLIKVLYWDRNGFCLWMKRLEEAQFHWPTSDQETVCIDRRALDWLLEGLNWVQGQKQSGLR